MQTETQTRKWCPDHHWTITPSGLWIEVWVTQTPLWGSSVLESPVPPKGGTQILNSSQFPCSLCSAATMISGGCCNVPSLNPALMSVMSEVGLGWRVPRSLRRILFIVRQLFDTFSLYKVFETKIPTEFHGRWWVPPDASLSYHSPNPSRC